MNAAYSSLSMPQNKLQLIVAGTVFLFIATALVLVSFQFGGQEGFVAAMTGVAFGGLLLFVTWCFARIQFRTNQNIVFKVLLASFLNMLLLGVGMIVLALTWRAALVPASLSALVIYLVFKFYMAFSSMKPTAKKPAVDAES